jgi:hypothetical protein
MRDLTGDKFGKLTVISYHGPLRPEHKKDKHQAWNCLCDCGKQKVVIGQRMKSGNTKSCGCGQGWHREKVDLVNKKFGKLLVTQKAEREQYWICLCECGQIVEVFSGSLTRGKSKSCGCLQGNFIHGLHGTKDYKKWYLSDPNKRLRHRIGICVCEAIKINGGKKGGSVLDKLPYTIQELREHLEKQFEPWMNWMNYGGKNNNPEKTWHIDHIMPQASLPYSSMDDENFLKCWSLSNLRPIEKIENIRKGKKTPIAVTWS